MRNLMVYDKDRVFRQLHESLLFTLRPAVEKTISLYPFNSFWSLNSLKLAAWKKSKFENKNFVKTG